MGISFAVTFAVLMPTLMVAHVVGDYWLQTNHQAVTKGRRDRAGQRACAAHVATYTVATAGSVVLVWVIFDLAITLVGFLLGQAISVVTHYWADRRFTLRGFILRFLPQKIDYYDLVPGGAENLDQAWHRFWLMLAALVTALV